MNSIQEILFDNSGADMCKDCAFWVKSTIFTGRLDFNMTMNIRYSAISKIDVDGKKIESLEKTR